MGVGKAVRDRAFAYQVGPENFCEIHGQWDFSAQPDYSTMLETDMTLGSAGSVQV
jgi:hypothetical protein